MSSYHLSAEPEKILGVELSVDEFQDATPFSRLLEIVFPASAKERNVAFYSAYFDESTAPKSPVLVVAGFLSTDAQWVLFEREWKGVLAEHNLTAFHMQHFAKNKSPYRSMSEPEKQKLLGSLLDIIRSRAKMGFATVVHVADFKDVMAGKIRGKVGSPYYLACAGCQLDIGKWAKKNYQIEPIAYFFDAGHKNWKELAQAFIAEKNNPANTEYRLGPLTFEHDNVLVPLQAADIAAYEIWRWLDEHFDGRPKHGVVL